MPSFRTLDQADLNGKRVLVRVDLNVPVENGTVTDATRIERAVPTIKAITDKGGKVILLSHFGRPKGRDPKESLRPAAQEVSRVIGKPVAFADDCIGEAAEKAVAAMKPGDVLCLENTRFHKEEEKNDKGFIDKLSVLGDVYINDAFSAAHRAHASTEGLALLLPAYAGEQMRRELDALDAALGKPKRPVLGIVGGSKVSTKLDLLNNLVGKLDRLAIGGGMANTFLAAQGIDVGASLCEHDLGDTAREIMATAKARGCELLLPVDVVVAEKVEPGAASAVRELNAIGPADRILDAGPKTLARLIAAMDASATLVWNGPLGVFEVPPFDKATVEAANHAARLAKAGKLVAVAGGGDTVAALNAAGVTGDFTFVSTAGGAFLEWMEGKSLPGVAALNEQVG
jgi:phosphoglycerate kinase